MFDSCFEKLKTDSRVRSEKTIRELRDQFSYEFHKINDPALTDQQRLDLAAQRVTDARKAAIVKREQRAMLHQQALDRTAALIKDYPDANPIDVISAQLMSRHDMKLKVASVEQKTSGMIRDTKRVTEPLWRALSDKLGFAQSQKAIKDFSESLFGVGQNAEMNKIVADLQTMQENFRLRRNAAGDDIAKLEGYRTVQKWSPEAVARGYQKIDPKLTGEARQKANLDHFVDFWMTRNDWDASRNVDGTMMSAEEREAFLRESAKSILYEGSNKDPVASFGNSGSKTSHHRQLHAKDPQAWREVMAEFGDGSPYNQITHFINKQALRIQMMETFGPRPIDAVDIATRTALQGMTETGADRTAFALNRRKAGLTTAQAKFMIGQVEDVRDHGTLIRTLEGWRNLNRVKLGSSVITSITDNATMRLTAAVNNAWGTTKFIAGLKNLNPKDTANRVLLENAGLVSEAFNRHIYTTVQQTLDHGWTRFVGDNTIRLSALSAFTEARRETLGTGLLNALGREVRDAATLADVAGPSRRILESRGFTEADWAELKSAKIGGQGSLGSSLLDPSSITNVHLREKVLGWLSEEVNLGVLEPGMREQFAMSWGAQKGTLLGSIAGSIMQFKAFPLSMISKHLSRARGLGAGGGTAYAMAMMLGTTAFGAIALQASALLKGQDPRNMTDDRFWLAALTKGGSMGVYGDALFSNERQLGDMLLGPSISDALKLGGILSRPVRMLNEKNPNWDEGAATDIAGDLVKMAAGYSPANTLWWSKTIADRLYLAQAQEALNPGYLDRQAAKTMSDYGQDAWWPRGSFAPERAPNMGAALGE